MSPVSVGTSRKATTKKTQQTTLWLLTIGVNQYLDQRLPNLRYSAVDCHDLSLVLKMATTQFPQKNISIYNDFAAELPLRSAVINSLQQITNNVQPEDTILFYFSGHGILHPDSNQAFLCLRDTYKNDLQNTALAVSELLDMLSSSAAQQQLVWLDACHSGGMTLRGANIVEPLLNPSLQLVEVLQKNAAKSQSFYALLSCDRNQQSWEFPELGHGVFTYYLIQGLRGEAVDSRGTISVDGLYRYVYYQTLEYIDKTNQQLRLINQQKRGKGDNQLYSEYPLQTPKRIVEGYGELILGNIPQVVESVSHKKALVITRDCNATLTFSKLLRGSAGFELEYLPRLGKDSSQDICQAIVECLLSKSEKSATVLLYLRGYLQEAPTGEVNLVVAEDICLSRSWLRRQLRRSGVSQQMIIFDLTTVDASVGEWVEDLQVDSEAGQCIIAAQSTTNSEQFVQALIETLGQASDSNSGLSAAGWITKLQVAMAGLIPLEVWLSGKKGVIEIIRATTGTNQKLQTTALDLGICPYQGLRAFTENDSQYFYGRDALIQQLINHLRTNSFLAVVGASGSGKSSVVRAGLIAQLRTGKQLPGSETWLIAKIRPGTRPLQVLARVLAGEEMQYLGVEGFVYWLRSQNSPMIILVVDQFEELFTLAPVEDRNRFLELLLGALEYASDKFKLVITLRADFITPCLQVAALAPLLQHSSILVPPHLQDTEYRRAIVNPAEQVGLKVESSLVEVLLQELNKSAGDLALLEFVLEQLWEHRQHGELTLFSYRKHLGGMAGALERKAQAVYESLDKSAQQCARWIFLSLTQLGEGTEDTRRRAIKSELIVKKYPPDLVERTLQALTTAKLIVVGLEDGGKIGVSRSDVETLNDQVFLEEVKQQVTIEVAHEILIRHWSTLRWWLSENRFRLRLQRQIEQAAQMWKNNGKQTDFLLQGVRLVEAEDIFIKYADELSQEVQEFIAACLDEKQRQQLEQKKRLRQAQTAVGIISVLGIVATGFGSLAYFKQQDAQIREINALNASSEALMLSHQQLEALIASLRAAKQLKSLFAPSEEIKLTTLTTLQQAVSQTREINRLQAHGERVNAVSFSSDGNFIASAGDDGNLILWNPNGKLIKTIVNPSQERITAVTFSPDSQLIAVGSADNNLRLYSIDGKLIQTFTEHQNWLTSITFSPDGKTIAAASRDETIKLWHIDGTLIKTWKAHQGWVNSVEFSPDGNQIISGGDDNLIKLWRNDGTLLKKFMFKKINGHQERITQIKFTSDGKIIISASGDKTVKIWDNQGKLLHTFDGYPGQINSISVNIKNNLLGVAHPGGIEIRTFQPQFLKNSQILEKLPNNGAAITDIKFSPDSQIIASASTDKTVKIWQIDKNKYPENQSIDSIATNPKTSSEISFAAAGWDGKIYLKSPDASLFKTLPGHSYPVTSLSFSPNGKLLASASNDKTIKLWNLENYSLIQTFKGHQDSVESISFSPDSKLLVSGSADKTVKLWNLNGKTIKTLPQPTDTVSSVVFSDDKKIIAAGSYDKKIYLWKLDGTLVNKFTGHKLAISSVKFSADNKILASASLDNYIKLWKIKNGELLKTLTGHTKGVTSLNFSQDDKLLISGSQNSTIKLWNLSNGNLLKTIFQDIGEINSLSFTHDNKTMIIASENAGVRIWNLDLDKLILQGCLKIENYLKNNPNVNQENVKNCNFTY